MKHPVRLPSGSAPARRLVRIGMVLAVMLPSVTVIALGGAPASANGTAVMVTRNVPYGTNPDGPLLLDVYRPAAARSLHPVVILIHGGGWTRGTREQFDPFARSLATAGFVVFNIDYSLDLSGSPGFPRQVQDVRTALAWVGEHAESYGGDPARIGVAGGSAGGYLAAMLGTQADASGAAPVRAVISLSGPMDLVALVADLRALVTSTSGQCAPEHCVAVQQAIGSLRSLLGCDPLDCPESLLHEASPIAYVTSASPPFFLAHGRQETVPTTQATRMAAALRSQDVPVVLDLVSGGRHSVEYVADIRQSLLTFLRANVGGAPPTPQGPAAGRPQDGQRPQEGHEPSGLLRPQLLPWLVVATALGLLAVIAVARSRRSTRRVRADGPHPPPGVSRDADRR